MARIRNQHEGMKIVSDVLNSFANKYEVARIIAEEGLLLTEEKGLMGVNKLVAPKDFMSFSIGGYNLIHAGIANMYIGYLDENAGISIDTLQQQMVQRIIDMTSKYYYDFDKGQPRQHVYTMARNILKKLISYGLIDMQHNKYYRSPFDAVEFITNIYGRALTHPTGISSWYRGMVISLISLETGGIEKNWVVNRLQSMHNLPRVKDWHLDIVLRCHGTRDGTGYIIADKGGFLYRCYKRIDQPLSTSPSVLQKHPKLMQLLLKTPAIGHDQIYEIFGNNIAQTLYLETGEIQPNLSQQIIVRRGPAYFTGKHVGMLKMREIEVEKTPSIPLITQLYSQFSSQDCMKVAFYAREVLGGLHKNGQYKPQNEYERKILIFLAHRKLVETDPLTGEDTFYRKNDQVIKQLSIIFGNIFD